MTIDELIERLEAFKQEYGGDTEIKMSVSYDVWDGDYSETERAEDLLTFVYYEPINGHLVVCDW